MVFSLIFLLVDYLCISASTVEWNHILITAQEKRKKKKKWKQLNQGTVRNYDAKASFLLYRQKGAWYLLPEKSFQQISSRPCSRVLIDQPSTLESLHPVRPRTRVADLSVFVRYFLIVGERLCFLVPAPFTSVMLVNCKSKRICYGVVKFIFQRTSIHRLWHMPPCCLS